MKTLRNSSIVAVVAALALSIQAAAQTKVTAPKNKYSPAQDVQLGREASAEVEKQLPILRNDEATSYVQSIGERLVARIPAELQHPEFRYGFAVVNVREINAFALPGGPMYVNRGMIQAAHSEGEVAGVMAHEMSHVALRHGTAQATKAGKYELLNIVGAITGAVVGGRTGNIIAQGTQFGVGTYFLKFSREYEKQADLLGAQIMARAGYDPREMANMFKTIEQQGGSGGPQWMSDHPNPGNRYDYINREAQSLHVENPVRDTRGFQTTQAALNRLPPAPKTEDAVKTAQGGGGGNRPTSAPVNTARVQPPSSQFRRYNAGDVFRVSVPSNWQQIGGGNAVTFAPEGAYGSVQGQNVFTHGMEIGVARNEADDLQTATEELIRSLAESNPRLGRASGYDRGTIGGQTALRTVLSNQSDVTGQPEQIELFTTQMRDGTFFYAIGVAPRDSFSDYERVFRKIVGTIQFTR